MLVQESKYRDAIRYYQPLIARNADNLLGVTAIVLANLCVSYIMTSQVRLKGGRVGVCMGCGGKREGALPRAGAVTS